MVSVPALKEKTGLFFPFLLFRPRNPLLVPGLAQRLPAFCAAREPGGGFPGEETSLLPPTVQPLLRKSWLGGGPSAGARLGRKGIRAVRAEANRPFRVQGPSTTEYRIQKTKDKRQNRAEQQRVVLVALVASCC